MAETPLADLTARFDLLHQPRAQSRGYLLGRSTAEVRGLGQGRLSSWRGHLQGALEEGQKFVRIPQRWVRAHGARWSRVRAGALGFRRMRSEGQAPSRARGNSKGVEVGRERDLACPGTGGGVAGPRTERLLEHWPAGRARPSRTLAAFVHRGPTPPLSARQTSTGWHLRTTGFRTVVVGEAAMRSRRVEQKRDRHGAGQH